MKIEIEIPKEFKYDYDTDRFKDFFERVLCDIKGGVLCGRYEQETAEMFIGAFKESKVIQSIFQKMPKEKSLTNLTSSDKSELLGSIIDIFEDWLDSKGITPSDIPNPEREEFEEDNPAIIFGSDYDELADKISVALGMTRNEDETPSYIPTQIRR